jgi:uncharacterized coiled-coil protein SlyX
VDHKFAVSAHKQTKEQNMFDILQAHELRHTQFEDAIERLTQSVFEVRQDLRKQEHLTRLVNQFRQEIDTVKAVLES